MFAKFWKLKISGLCLRATVLLMPFFCQTAFAATVPLQVIPAYNMKQYNAAIQRLYQQPASHAPAFIDRLNFDSAYFMGKPYRMFPLGEGPSAYFDKNPLYRTDVFDCLTYVDTVVALANSHNLPQFQQNFKLMSYEKGQVTFLARNHFITSDWNENNAKMGFVRDITSSFRDANNHSPVLYASTVIDKPNWYRMMLPQRIRVFAYPGDKQATQLLNALREQASEVKAQKASIAYIPMKAFFTANGQPDLVLLNQIPSGAVIEIVRPNWDLRYLIGTRLLVSHLGFVIRTSKGLMFREASTDKHAVVQILLIDYLRQFAATTPIEGINVEQVLSR